MWVKWSGLAMPPKILVEHLTRPHFSFPMLTPSEEPPWALPMAFGPSNSGPFLILFVAKHIVLNCCYIIFYFIILVSILFFCI